MRDTQGNDAFSTPRKRMVDEQLKTRDITDDRVLRAMGAVPRELFVLYEQRDAAYSDGPLSIGFDQTISQPYMVASMTQTLALQPRSRVLEIGTGSGYQTAILSLIAAHVYTIEIVPELHCRAATLLKELEFGNVSWRLGDGSLGWPEEAPFDGILVAAATPRVPPALFEQLGPSGRMVIPICLSDSRQELRLYKRSPRGIDCQTLYDVRFVPMQGNVDFPEP